MGTLEVLMPQADMINPIPVREVLTVARIVRVNHTGAALHALSRRHASPKITPCRVMPFWSYGGWWLGFLTALVGRQGIWACTAAGKTVVHRHLDDQLHFLRGRDPELAGIIPSIRDEEIAHPRHAEERLVSRSVAFRSLRVAVSMATDLPDLAFELGRFDPDGTRAKGRQPVGLAGDARTCPIDDAQFQSTRFLKLPA